MLTWLVAALLGAGIAAALYRWADPRSSRGLPVALRALALTLVIALLLDAPAGPSRTPPPLVALDVSQSWTRDGDTTAWVRARSLARAAGGDSLLLFGDSVRAGRAPATPTDEATRTRSLAERALGAGRALILVTDGEVDDPGAIPALPGGSRIDVIPHRPARDVAVVSIDAPRATVSGDTVDARITVRTDSLPTPAGTVQLDVADRPVARATLDAMASRTERTVGLRVAITGAIGPSTLTAIVQVPGDAEPRNDTVGVPIDIARAAGAVLASTSPDFDARFVLPVLRGAVALPTRAFYRVAPGQWRQDGTLAPVSETAVREALHASPLAIIHGDTAYFGAPRTATTGSLALLAPPTDSTGEWYAVGAPPSPIAPALAGIDWDSLPPVSVSGRPPVGDWDGLTVARARRFDLRPVIAGSAVGRRVVIVSGGGFWRWQFRGGAAADAFVALWGSIFDWLSAERPDARAAIPAEGVIRAGDRIRWRRGTSATDSVRAIVQRRGSARPDSVMLRFGAGATVAESDPLPPGTYDVQVPGGSSVLVVNESRELLPRPLTVRGGAAGGGVVPGNAPRVRDIGWIYVLVIAALCAEWLLRRRRGLS